MDDAGEIAVADEAGASARLILAGKVTIGSVDKLYQAALDLASRRVSVSVCCDELEYLDAAGIQVLLCLGRDLASRGIGCQVTGVQGRLQEEFRLAGL